MQVPLPHRTGPAHREEAAEEPGLQLLRRRPAPSRAQGKPQFHKYALDIHHLEQEICRIKWLLERGEAMSSGMFEGLEGAVGQQDSESYIPGTEGLGLPNRMNPVAQALVSDFLDPVRRHSFWELAHESHFYEGYMETAVRVCSDIIREGGISTNPNGLLEDIIAEVYRRTDAEAAGSCGPVLDATMQALYRMGHNDFVVDLLPWLLDFTSVAYHLRGTISRPLKARYIGHIIDTFGQNTRHCDLTLQGDANVAGYSLLCSRLEVTGAAEFIG